MFDMLNPPLVRLPRRPPVSLWDQEWAHNTGAPVPPGMHYVLGEGLVSADDLYQRDRAKRGRPLRFTLPEARAIKHAYWTGTETIVALAERHAVTEVTISRLVHGYTYWYA